MERYFQLACHALIVTAFLSLSLTGRLDAPSIVIFVGGWTYSLYRTIRSMPPAFSERAGFVFSSAYIPFFFVDALILSGSFITAIVHMVVSLVMAKLFQKKTDKDYTYLIILAFLMVLAASSLTIDMSFLAVLLLFLVALVATLMSFDMFRSARSTDARAEGIGGPISGMSIWATLWIVVIGVGLFLMLPRVETTYFTRAATTGLLMTGFNESVNLGEIGQIKQSRAVVMRAKPLGVGRGPAVIKWRGLALNAFDGRKWYRQGGNRSVIRPTQGIYHIQPMAWTGEVARYEIFLEPLATTALFGPNEIRTITSNQNQLEVDSENSIYLRLQSLRRTRYEVLSELPPRPKFLEAAPVAGIEEIPAAIRNRYLQVPADLDPRIRQLAQQITREGNSIFEKATLVEDHLKRGYGYTLNLDWQPGPQPLATFLFDAKAGHCEYFASSMAILLRTVGVPTRLVNGFLTGEYNPVGDDFIVRQSDAHSWVEVYAPKHGWVEFDPTPPDPNPRQLGLLGQVAHYIDAVELFWTSYIIVYDTQSQLSLFRTTQERVQTAYEKAMDWFTYWVDRGRIFSDRVSVQIRTAVESPNFWLAVAWVFLTGFILNNRRTLLTQIRIWRLRLRRSGSVDEDVVEQLFYRAARVVERRTHRRRPPETWREWLVGVPEIPRRMIAQALSIFEKSKYGRAPVTTEEFFVLEETAKRLAERG